MKKKLKRSDVKMNNAMAALIMIVIGLTGVFALSRSVVYENRYLVGVANSQNCGMITKSSTSQTVQDCIIATLNNSDHNRVQAQIYEIAGTAMITAAVVSSLSVLQMKKLKD